MKTIFYTFGYMLAFILRPAAILYGWELFVVPLGGYKYNVFSRCWLIWAYDSFYFSVYKSRAKY